MSILREIEAREQNTPVSKYAALFQWLRGCPQLSNLWSIAATENIGVRVILPQGSSQTFMYNERRDTLGNYECDMIPFNSIYEDYQINAYQIYDAADSSEPGSNINVLSLDEVQSICDWIAEQNESESTLPVIDGLQIVSVECNPGMPQIRFVNPEDNTVGYFITLRLRYVNRAKGRSVCFECNNNDK